MHSDFEALKIRWSWFQRVRKALRYRNGPIPLSTRISLSEKDLEKGRKKLDRVLEKSQEFDERGATDHHSRELKKALRKVGNLIEEHREELFAPNVRVKVNGRNVIRKLPRTNTPDESDFRKTRRHGRRIKGNEDVEAQVQREGVGMLLALNLTDREYVQAVYGSLAGMARRFIRVQPESRAEAKSLMGVSVE
ncbi:MAG: hypothetical protein AB1665_00700 [Candidatus Thermoplasmatota archaeon]